jgi:hypothetical protein
MRSKKISPNQIDFYERLNSVETISDRTVPKTGNPSGNILSGVKKSKAKKT